MVMLSSSSFGGEYSFEGNEEAELRQEIAEHEAKNYILIYVLEPVPNGNPGEIVAAVPTAVRRLVKERKAFIATQEQIDAFLDRRKNIRKTADTVSKIEAYLGGSIPIDERPGWFRALRVGSLTHRAERAVRYA